MAIVIQPRYPFMVPRFARSEITKDQAECISDRLNWHMCRYTNQTPALFQENLKKEFRFYHRLYSLINDFKDMQLGQDLSGWICDNAGFEPFTANPELEFKVVDKALENLPVDIRHEAGVLLLNEEVVEFRAVDIFLADKDFEAYDQYGVAFVIVPVEQVLNSLYFCPSANDPDHFVAVESDPKHAAAYLRVLAAIRGF